MAGDRVARSPFDPVQGPFELGIREGFDLPAAVADEVMVVLAVRVDRLEARDAGADVDSLDEAVTGQLLECAIDARGPDATPLGPQLVEDLLRGQASVLAPE